MKLLKILTTVLLMLPLALHAQEDAKYMAGAVPEVNGKVVFSTQLAVEGMNAADVFNHMKTWAQKVCQREEAIEGKSRIAISDEKKGELAVIAEEYIVFSKGLALDRTRIFYNLRINCRAGHARIEMTNIRYLYDENRNGGERYTAEEIITDKECLNKDKTKMYKQVAKFRKKTIDLKDELFQDATKAFGYQETIAAKQIAAKPEKETTEVKAEIPAQKEETMQKQTHIAVDINKVQVKDTVSFTVQEGSALYELLQKTEKATLTVISENGSAQVLQFRKASTSKAKDGHSCTFTGELSK